jgi:hypothetical protein
MYLKKEIIISFFIITISASNLYMPMIWLYVFLQDFLIPFLCDPDLQCMQPPNPKTVYKCTRLILICEIKIKKNGTGHQIFKIILLIIHSKCIHKSLKCEKKSNKICTRSEFFAYSPDEKMTVHRSYIKRTGTTTGKPELSEKRERRIILLY